MKIYLLEENPTAVFAAGELCKYLSAISKRTVKVESRGTYSPGEGIWLGREEAFPGISLPDVKNPALDDAVYIDVKGESGIISGNNSRSILLAVYRYLTELGCRWVRPGPDGEHLPETDVSDRSVKVAESPSYRHRGICIEGACSYENVRDIIDWAPKVGLNAYFTQFRESFAFFDRWYSHQNNHFKEPEPFSVEQSKKYLAAAVGEIKKRGLVYHAVGHGWTCEPLGMRGISWDYKDADAPAEAKPYLAEVNGKREPWKGVALNTNLCYSNPEVRKLLNESIRDYLEENPETDLLHFWLADGSNNHCECPDCSGLRPSDFYVRMLNELDEMLTEKNIDTKIVFLIYVDLLWPPVKETIASPDRFVMMFAPIKRTYSEDYALKKPVPEIPDYIRNKLVFPSGIAENIAMLRGWQKIFKGDSFVYDYHYWSDHYRDPGCLREASVLHTDIQHLAGHGINGFMSCQVQRAFFPAGLGMAVMGKTLWNSETAFEDISEDYFESAFGPDGRLCRQYLEKLSEHFDPPYLRNEKKEVNKDSADKFGRIPGLVREFEPVIERNMGTEDECRRKSWQYLKHHAEICVPLSKALRARSEGNSNMANKHWQAVKNMACVKEDALQPVFDVFNFIRTLDDLFGQLAKLKANMDT